LKKALPPTITIFRKEKETSHYKRDSVSR